MYPSQYKEYQPSDFPTIPSEEAIQNFMEQSKAEELEWLRYFPSQLSARSRDASDYVTANPHITKDVTEFMHAK